MGPHCPSLHQLPSGCSSLRSEELGLFRAVQPLLIPHSPWVAVGDELSLVTGNHCPLFKAYSYYNRILLLTTENLESIAKREELK